MDKISLRRGPGRFEEILDADEIILREAIQRRRPIAARVKKLAEDNRFLRDDAQSGRRRRVFDPAPLIAPVWL